MNDILSEINGSSVTVSEFSIEHSCGALAVKMQCAAENGKSYFIIFQNVSEINMRNVVYPFQIDGFEIHDYSSRGYQKECRFFAEDYEDGTLSFYCEGFEIFEAVCENGDK